jgi:hypothetical protein
MGKSIKLSIEDARRLAQDKTVTATDLRWQHVDPPTVPLSKEPIKLQLTSVSKKKKKKKKKTQSDS